MPKRGLGIDVLEAARRTGARRVILASSNHVTGLYPTGSTLPEETIKACWDADVILSGAAIHAWLVALSTFGLLTLGAPVHAAPQYHLAHEVKLPGDDGWERGAFVSQ